ncbi:hypothetical protein ACWDRR_15565, partial [Kitasatospora sp. NPDC003701]
AKAAAWSAVIDSDELPNALVEANIAGPGRPHRCGIRRTAVRGAGRAVYRDHQVSREDWSA